MGACALSSRAFPRITLPISCVQKYPANLLFPSLIFAWLRTILRSLRWTTFCCKVVPGADEYITEKYAFEIMQLLGEWSRALKTAPPALAILTKFLDSSVEAASLLPTREIAPRPGNGIEVLRRRFPEDVLSGREKFLREIENYFSPMVRVETAEFEIVGIEETAGSSGRIRRRHSI